MTMASTTGQNFGSTSGGQKNPTETYASDANKGGNAGGQRAGNTGNSGSSTGGAGSIAERASEVASNVAQQARKVGENIGERAQDAMQAVQSGIKQAGETIRDYVPSGSRVSDAFSSTRGYLQDNLGNVGEDLTSMVRRNPIPALLCAAALGFMLARVTRS